MLENVGILAFSYSGFIFTRVGTSAFCAVNIVSDFVDKLLKYNDKKIKVTSGNKFTHKLNIVHS